MDILSILVISAHPVLFELMLSFFLGIAIDNFGSTRNIWYAVHRSEDIETHNWVFNNHLRGACRPPEVLGSDRHPSIIGAVPYVAVLSDGHYICDCCMPANLGIPCRHFFRIWINVQNLPFHISHIRPR
jgi:hypothetical protein